MYQALQFVKTGETRINHKDCKQPQKCVNFQQNHAAGSKEYKIWKKNIKSQILKKYIILKSKEVSWKFCSHNNLCKCSQTDKQLNPKSRNDPLQDDNSNKRTESTKNSTQTTRNS